MMSNGFIISKWKLWFKVTDINQRQATKTTDIQKSIHDQRKQSLPQIRDLCAHSEERYDEKLVNGKQTKTNEHHSDTNTEGNRSHFSEVAGVTGNADTGHYTDSERLEEGIRKSFTEIADVTETARIPNEVCGKAPQVRGHKTTVRKDKPTDRLNSYNGKVSPFDFEQLTSTCSSHPNNNSIMETSL